MLLVSDPAWSQQTVVLQQGVDGYEGTDDSTIYEESPTFSNGGYDSIFAGKTRGLELTTLRRSAIRFDLSSIPSNAQVTAVTLSLVIAQSASSDQPHNLHPIQKDWDEGTVSGIQRGGASDPGDMTWADNMSGSSSWTNLGGDFGPSSAQTFVGDAGNTIHFSSAAMASEVQGWIDAPANNFGWMMLGNEASLKTAKRFHSSEATLQANRPILTVVFESAAPPPVSTWRLR